MADKHEVDTAKPQLRYTQEDINDPPSGPGCSPQPRTLGSGKTCLRYVGIGEEGEVRPPTQLLRVVNCEQINIVRSMFGNNIDR